ncbi:MAG: hypothetical protein C4325_01285 [Blastocatellia bacterium]
MPKSRSIRAKATSLAKAGTLSCNSLSAITKGSGKRSARVPIAWPIFINVGPSSINLFLSHSACFF